MLLGSLSSPSEFPLLLLTNNRFNDNIMRTSPGGRVEQTGHQFFTMLDVLHLQMQAGYEDANRLRAFPIQQFNNLEKEKESNLSIY